MIAPLKSTGRHGHLLDLTYNEKSAALIQETQRRQYEGHNTPL